MGALREPELLKLECEPRKIQFCILKAQLPNYQSYAIIASASNAQLKTGNYKLK